MWRESERERETIETMFRFQECKETLNLFAWIHYDSRFFLWFCLILFVYSPHHCVGFLFLALHPLPSPSPSPPPPPPSPPSSVLLLTLISHTLISHTTHHTFISHTIHLTPTHDTHTITHIHLTHITHLTQISHTPFHTHSSHTCSHHTHSSHTNLSNTFCIWGYFCVASSAFWLSGKCWCSFGRRWATFAWQAQHFDPLGVACARLVAAGDRVLLRGRRSTLCI